MSDRPPASIDQVSFCRGMRRLAAGVCVIASAVGEERAGLTATAVCSVTAEPPRLLVCVNQAVQAHRIIARSKRLSVNVLDQAQKEIARRFAGMVEGVQGDERFADNVWECSQSGLPTLRDALAVFECHVAEAKAMGTHTVFLCNVTRVCLGPGGEGPLMYFDGNFASVA